MRFTGVAQARLDDQFDSTATLCIGLDKIPPIEEDDLIAAQSQDEEMEDEEESFYRQQGMMEDRNHVTGY